MNYHFLPARWLLALLVSVIAACGGGGGGGGTPAATTPAGTQATARPPGPPIDGPVITGSNVLRVAVDGGVNGQSINVPYVTVTVCVPGTGTCVDIDHVTVDTGSTGLRVNASALGALGLPGVTTNAGNPAAQCAQFASGITWGGVRRADVRLGSQTASNVSVQVIDDPAFPTVPTECTNAGARLQAGGASKGILGVGVHIQDCGVSCDGSLGGVVVPFYYGCPTQSTCGPGAVALGAQVTNPVAVLPADNNGVVLVLPAVPSGGSTRVTGSLLLGIGTQANNQLNGATVLTTTPSGYFTTTYKGVSYPRSFIDSGSNGYFFSDTALPQCSVSTDFFCPPSPVTLSATHVGQNAVSRQVDFLLDAVDPLAATTVAAHIGGSTGTNQQLATAFDWGLPFFYGRSVFTAISGKPTPAGTGPYYAW